MEQLFPYKPWPFPAETESKGRTHTAQSAARAETLQELQETSSLGPAGTEHPHHGGEILQECPCVTVPLWPGRPRVPGVD